MYSTSYIIIPIGESLEYCAEIYKKLLSRGESIEIYLEDDKLKKKLNYANKIGVPKVILIGEDEVLNREVKIKDMITGVEEKFNLSEILK